MAIGEWNERALYAVTELIFFLLATIVLFLASAALFVYKYVHHRNKVTFFFTLRSLFENILPSAIAFTPATNGRINLVFLGHQEKSRDQKGLCCKLNLVRVWVHVYFVILCGLIMMWAVSVFSNSVLYRKTSSCTDLSLADTDMSCFLLSNEDIPDGVKEIIDEEEGDLVPCQKNTKLHCCSKPNIRPGGGLLSVLVEPVSSPRCVVWCYESHFFCYCLHSKCCVYSHQVSQ